MELGPGLLSTRSRRVVVGPWNARQLTTTSLTVAYTVPPPCRYPSVDTVHEAVVRMMCRSEGVGLLIVRTGGEIWIATNTGLLGSCQRRDGVI